MKRLRKRLPRIFLMLLALAAAFVVFPAVNASAGTNDGYCNSNEICVYKNANLGTPRSDFLYYYKDMGGCPDCHTYNYPSSCNTYKSLSCLLNDSISSMDSWSDHRSVRFFTSNYFDGSYEKVGIYGTVDQAHYNDAYSSECWNDGGISYSYDPDCTFAD